MSTTTRTTELEAINTMLNCISEAPINDLDVTGLQDVDIAKSVLNEVSRKVQEEGWHFNTENDYPLIRNAAGELTVAPNVLKIDTTARFSQVDVTQRGSRLYDKKNRTYIFDQDIEVDIVWLFSFEELPEAARQYIMVRASRVFQARQLGSDTQHKFSEQDEYLARSSIMDTEGENADHNILNDSWAVARILHGRRG